MCKKCIFRKNSFVHRMIYEFPECMLTNRICVYNSNDQDKCSKYLNINDVCKHHNRYKKW